jgi:hypothetical protein
MEKDAKNAHDTTHNTTPNAERTPDYTTNHHPTHPSPSQHSAQTEYRSSSSPIEPRNNRGLPANVGKDQRHHDAVDTRERANTESVREVYDASLGVVVLEKAEGTSSS